LACNDLVPNQIVGHPRDLWRCGCCTSCSAVSSGGWRRSARPAAKDAQILVLRRQNALLRRRRPKPRLDWADRVVLTGLIRLLPRVLRAHRWSRRPQLSAVAGEDGDGVAAVL